MGVRTLDGIYDGTRRAAAMVDSTSGWMVGPIWEAEDAVEQIDAFLDWLRLLQFMSRAEEIGLESRDLPNPMRGDGGDPREWPDSGLAKLVAFWRREHVDEEGLLQETV